MVERRFEGALAARRVLDDSLGVGAAAAAAAVAAFCDGGADCEFWEDAFWLCCWPWLCECECECEWAWVCVLELALATLATLTTLPATLAATLPLGERASECEERDMRDGRCVGR
jgi:hypothetical protein